MAASTTNTPAAITCDFADFANSHGAIWTARNIHFSNGEGQGCLNDVTFSKRKLTAWGANKI